MTTYHVAEPSSNLYHLRVASVLTARHAEASAVPASVLV